jgi:hypothetical protein
MKFTVKDLLAIAFPLIALITILLRAKEVTNLPLKLMGIISRCRKW